MSALPGLLLLVCLIPATALHGLLGQFRGDLKEFNDLGDALSILQDRPQGAYSHMMGAVVQAIGLSYNTSTGPDFVPSQANATISSAATGGDQWERLFEFDRDPSPGGIHARVFVDRKNSRVIIAFRGSCLDPKVQQCRLDACFLSSINGFGVLSPVVYQTNSSECEKFKDKLDYVEQADQLVRAVQAELPGYEVFLVGHSMGGMLAVVAAAIQPHAVKAITFAPTPFHEALLEGLGWSQAQIANLPAENLISACDPYDCGINSLYVDQARLGSTTCLYFGSEEPSVCEQLPAQPYASTSWRSEMQPNGNGIDILRVRANLQCKASAHEWSRYEGYVLRTKPDGSPAFLPSCSASFSVVQEQLKEQMMQLRTFS